MPEPNHRLMSTLLAAMTTHKQTNDAVPPTQTNKYTIIYADPPWRYADKLIRDTIEVHYPTMSIDELAALPVHDMAAADCALLMWATGPLMPDALALMQRWGFEYRTVFMTWVKTYADGKVVSGPGRYTKSCCEFLLLGVKGKMAKHRQKRTVRAVVDCPEPDEHSHGAEEFGSALYSYRAGHSRKPDIVRRKIVEVFGEDTPRIELFATQRTAGWEYWGRSVPVQPSICEMFAPKQ